MATDTEKIELLRAAIARIQVQRVDAYTTLDNALSRLNAGQEVEGQGITMQRLAADDIATLRAQLATLAASEDQYSRDLADLQRIIGVVDATAATTDPAATPTDPTATTV